MPIHPLAERLRTLGLAAMADAFLEMQNHSDAADLTREDWLGLLLDRGITARDGKRLARRLSVARLRQNAVVEDTDFRAPRGLDRPLFHKLAGCDWIRRSQHLVISGPTGTGKSWLACALGNRACREGISVLYRRARGCSPNSPPPAAKEDCRGCWRCWNAPGCRSSTTGDPSR